MKKSVIASLDEIQACIPAWSCLRPLEAMHEELNDLETTSRWIDHHHDECDTSFQEVKEARILGSLFRHLVSYCTEVGVPLQKVVEEALLPEDEE